jgi:hypothetical protein
MRYGWGTSSRNVLFFPIAIFGCQRVVGNPPKDTEVIYDISLVWLVGYCFSIFLGQIDGLKPKFEKQPFKESGLADDL